MSAHLLSHFIKIDREIPINVKIKNLIGVHWELIKQTRLSTVNNMVKCTMSTWMSLKNLNNNKTTLCGLKLKQKVRINMSRKMPIKRATPKDGFVISIFETCRNK